MAEVVDHHRRSAQEIALAGREQHVHLARVGRSETSWAIADELVGRLAARRQDRDDAVARLLRAATIRRGGALDALGVGHGGAAELHDDGLTGFGHGVER